MTEISEIHTLTTQTHQHHRRIRELTTTPFIAAILSLTDNSMIATQQTKQPEPNLAATSKQNARYILPIVLLCVFSLFQLVGEGSTLQNLRGSDDIPKASEQLLRLEHAEEEVNKLKSQLEESKEQIEKLQNESTTAATATATATTTTTTTTTTTSNFTSALSTFDPTNVCSVFPIHGGPSATRLWKENHPAIFEAAKNPAMEKDFHLDGEWDRLKVIVEEILSPARMRRSIQHMPTFSHHIVGHVMEIIQKRMVDPDNNPPLQIAVFGGSVTLGRDCAVKGRVSHLDCAWPYRFEHFVNQFLGQELITVHNLAIGGTNTGSATNRVKYWMYGPKLDKMGPDVIINSKSTNDALPPWGKNWPEDDLVTMVREAVHESNQKFIRAALETKPCEIPPLVVHVDDYLGPQQPALLGELAYINTITQLAKYYDTVAISYGEVVRDIVYQDQDETTFHNKADVHYGRFAHTTIALSVAFASLELLINYCDDEYNKNKNIGGFIATGEEEKKDRLITKDEMKRGKLFLPPPLTKELLQQNATIEFDAALDASYQAYVDNDCASKSDTIVKDRNPCMISWIASPGLWNQNDIKQFMRKHQIQNDGWEVEHSKSEGWSRKDGWIASKADATFTLQFVATKNVNTVTIYFLRSWGEKWKDSKARFTVSRLLPNDKSDGKVVAELEIDGVHADEDYHYSLTQSERIQLGETVEMGEKINLRVDLLSGSHFKIMGLMLCSK